LERLVVKLLDLVEILSGRILPLKFGKHYVRPRLERRKQVPYDGKAYFESFYKSSMAKEFSDGVTLRPKYNPLFVRFHYNAVENLIIEYFASRNATSEPVVLDIGSGAGHWIDFYLEVFRAGRVMGTEISESAVRGLSAKYESVDNVDVMEADISSTGLDLGMKFDIINAVGVMFHIVDDGHWEEAVANIARHLSEEGVAVIGGQFGRATRNVQFHNSDHFESWDQASAASSDVALVNKRIRSLRRWRSCAGLAGLRVDCVKRARGRKDIEMPENNIMILKRPSR
jgi:SAM-dependent methyltransferase